MDNGIDRETLRAELGALELRLVDRLAGALESKADAKVVEQHHARISSLELSRASREDMPKDIESLRTEVTSLSSFRVAVKAQWALLSFITVILATASWHIWG